MRASERLRETTAIEHKAAETRLNAASILDGSLTLADFHKMISLHFQVWSAVADWWPNDELAEPQADEFLGHMVEQLRLDMAANSIPATPALSLNFSTEPAATRYGVLYVLHGSTLGGTMINRKLRACTSLKPLPAFHFHAACEALPGKAWPVFLRELNASVQTENELARAVAGAKAVFGLYLR